MGQKHIDAIQTQQITVLESDINELKTKLNLLVDDINRSTTGAVAIVNSIINNINNMFDCLSGVTAVGNLGRYANNNSDNPATPRPTDGILKRLTEIDDLYTQHISRKFPPLIDLVSRPQIGYTGLTHTHPEGWVCNSGTLVGASMSMSSGSWPSGTHSLVNVQFEPDPEPAGWTADMTARGHVTVVNGSLSSVDWVHPFFGGSHANNNPGYGWSIGDDFTETLSYGSVLTGTVTSIGTQCQTVPSTNAGTLRSPERNASSGFGDDSPGIGGPAEQAIQAGGETSSGAILESSSAMHPDEASTTVVNASVVADYPTTAANVFFLEDEKKADIARAKKLARKTLNTLRSK